MNFKDLIKGTITIATASVVTSVGALLLMPFYVRLIAPAKFGVIGLLDPLTDLVCAILVLGIYAAFRREMVELAEDKRELGIFMTTTHLILIVWNVFLIVLLSLPLVRAIYVPLLGLQNVNFIYIFLSIFNASLLAFLLVAQNYFLFKRNYWFLGKVDILSFVLINVFAFSLIFFSGDVVLAKVLSTTIALIIVLVVMYKRFFKLFVFKFKFKYVKPSVSFGYPIMIGSILGILISRSPRYFLARDFSLSLVGIYSVAFIISNFMTMMVAAFNNCWIPQFFRSMKEDKDRTQIADYILIFALGIVLLSTLGQLFFKEISSVFLSSKYAGVTDLVVLLLPNFVIMGIFQIVGNYFQYYRKNLILTYHLIFMAILKFSLYWLALSKVGLETTIILDSILSYLLTLLLVFMVERMFGQKLPAFKLSIAVLLVLNPIIFKIADNAWPITISLPLKFIYLIFVIIVALLLFPISKRFKLLKMIKLSGLR